MTVSNAFSFNGRPVHIVIDVYSIIRIEKWDDNEWRRYGCARCASIDALASISPSHTCPYIGAEAGRGHKTRCGINDEHYLFSCFCFCFPLLGAVSNDANQLTSWLLVDLVWPGIDERERFRKWIISFWNFIVRWENVFICTISFGRCPRMLVRQRQMPDTRRRRRRALLFVYIKVVRFESGFSKIIAELTMRLWVNVCVCDAKARYPMNAVGRSSAMCAKAIYSYLFISSNLHAAETSGSNETKQKPKLK